MVLRQDFQLDQVVIMPQRYAHLPHRLGTHIRVPPRTDNLEPNVATARLPDHLVTERYRLHLKGWVVEVISVLADPNFGRQKLDVK